MGQNTIIHELIYAWTKLGEGNKLAAQDIISKLHRTGSIPGLTGYHYALISEIAGNDAKAEDLYNQLTSQRNYTNAIATALIDSSIRKAMKRLNKLSQLSLTGQRIS